MENKKGHLPNLIFDFEKNKIQFFVLVVFIVVDFRKLYGYL